MTEEKPLKDSLKVAWLLQGAGHYWQPIISEFTRIISITKVFTSSWPGFLPGFEDSISVEQVGKIKIISNNQQKKGYGNSFTYLSPSIVSHLWKYKPDVVFSVSFSLWTIFALLFKFWGEWQVIITLDGSSPGVDHLNSKLRLFLRRLMAKFTAGFITNTDAGAKYLIDVIGARKETVFVIPYLVPHPQTYCFEYPHLKLAPSIQHPIFITAGKLIARKGITELLKACSILQEKGYHNYTLLVVGDGIQRRELEELAKSNQISEQIQFVGRVPYEQMGAYYQQADIFVFPTLEDVWGLVAVEAMMFGKSILCSQWAGAAEMVKDGENGYIFDPHQPEKLAELMGKFIERPDLIEQMGAKSQEIMANYTPNTVAKNLAEVVEFVLTK